MTKVDPNVAKSVYRSTDQSILPLIPEVIKHPKDKLLNFKLRTVPTDVDSPTYELTIPILTGKESVREALDWHANRYKIWTGMNAMGTADTMDGLAKQTITDSALTLYLSAREDAKGLAWLALKRAALEASVNAGETAAEQQAAVAAVAEPALAGEHVVTGVLGVVNFMVPYKGLQRQKRYMRRKCRKPADMTARVFYNHFARMNDMELPRMPPNFNDQQKLGADEITDILLHAFPASWSGEMERQGFDPFTKHPIEILEFCERIEAAEQISTPVKNQGGSNQKKGSPNKKSSGKGSSGEHYCIHHGKNSTHSTNDCRTLQQQSKKLKGSNSSGDYKNKTWSRKAEQSKDKSKKELAAFMRKTVRKELLAMSKKRKKDDDDESVGSLNQLDEVDLSKFNYEDMDDLKIDSDDSSMDQSEHFETEAEA